MDREVLEWAIPSLLTALGIGVTIGAWVHKLLVDRREVMPIVRTRGERIQGGSVVYVTVMNRINEDLRIVGAKSDSGLSLPEITQDDYGEEVEGFAPSRTAPKAIPLDWKIPANETDHMRLVISDPWASRCISFRLSSSNGTIQNRKIISEPEFGRAETNGASAPDATRWPSTAPTSRR